MKQFEFYRKKPDVSAHTNQRFVLVPQHVIHKTDLFALYSKQLDFPYYLGNNWDALYDCMSDLTWIPEYTIVLIHEDIPFASLETEKNIYIKLLDDIADNWESGSNHEIHIQFPESSKNELVKFLS